MRSATATCIVLCLAGCQNSSLREPTPPPSAAAHDQLIPRRVAVASAWQAHAMEDYDRAVKSGLLAPSTAHVQPPTSIGSGIGRGTDGRYMRYLWASGIVDSQNAFGAMIRSDYTAYWTAAYQPGNLN